MEKFSAHEGQDSVVVRGTMHHAIMSVSEFTAWLERENCTRSMWADDSRMVAQSCRIYRSDGSHRSTAMKLYGADFPA